MTFCFWSVYINGIALPSPSGEIYLWESFKEAYHAVWNFYGCYGKKFGIEVYAA